MAHLPKKNAPKRTFKKVEAGGEVVKFENVGDAIEGVLKAKRTVKRKDGSMSSIYDVEVDSGKMFSIWGTGYLDTRMALVEPESYIRITLTGEEPPTVKGYSPMKVFDVEIAINVEEGE